MNNNDLNNDEIRRQLRAVDALNGVITGAGGAAITR